MELVADETERLDRFLARMLRQHSRTKLSKLISDGGVLVDGRPRKSSFIVEPGMTVAVGEVPESTAHDLRPASIDLDVVFEDEYLLVVNKPRGLATHPAPSLKEPSLVNALLGRSHGLSGVAGSFRPGIVHRLDKETTGLIMVAKTDAAHVALAKQIEGKEAERRYVAIVAGDLAQDTFTVNAPLARDPTNRLRMSVQEAGKHAVTHVKKLARVPAGTLVVCRLETGRTHQIRVHLAAVGYPVLGDAHYGPSGMGDLAMQLHAAYLSFRHPVSGELIEFYSAPPPEFLAKVDEDGVRNF